VSNGPRRQVGAPTFPLFADVSEVGAVGLEPTLYGF
jgi:hypothetical protein